MTRTATLLQTVAIGLLAGLALGCDGEAHTPAAAPPPRKPAPEPKRSLLYKNIYLETQGDVRRVVVNAEVVLREGPLEQLLCRKKTKEHESILAADIDARELHAALMATKAEPGSPVQWQPRYRPATGTRIQVSIQYEDDGKLVTVPAQQWIRSLKTGKDLDQDWVFAGSRLEPNPEDPMKPPHYMANDGDVICIANFDTALLDLPIRSPEANDDRAFEAHTARIPPKNTKVIVILEPIPEKKE